MALCLLGGVGGILAGWVPTGAIARDAGWPTFFSPGAMAAAVTVSHQPS